MNIFKNFPRLGLERTIDKILKSSIPSSDKSKLIKMFLKKNTRSKTNKARLLFKSNFRGNNALRSNLINYIERIENTPPPSSTRSFTPFSSTSNRFKSVLNRPGGNSRAKAAELALILRSNRSNLNKRIKMIGESNLNTNSKEYLFEIIDEIKQNMEERRRNIIRNRNRSRRYREEYRNRSRGYREEYNENENVNFKRKVLLKQPETMPSTRTGSNEVPTLSFGNNLGGGGGGVRNNLGGGGGVRNNLGGGGGVRNNLGGGGGVRNNNLGGGNMGVRNNNLGGGNMGVRNNNLGGGNMGVRNNLGGGNMGVRNNIVKYYNTIANRNYQEPIKKKKSRPVKMKLLKSVISDVKKKKLISQIKRLKKKDVEKILKQPKNGLVKYIIKQIRPSLKKKKNKKSVQEPSPKRNMIFQNGGGNQRLRSPNVRNTFGNNFRNRTFVP